MYMTELFDLLTDKNNAVAYRALQTLLDVSKQSDAVYAFMDRLIEMTDSDNSYIRTRGMMLIAENVRWDVQNKIDACIGKYLTHITDEKPITARQCIKTLPLIARHKPHLRESILTALRGADLSRYSESMFPLVLKDISNCIGQIERQGRKQ